MIDEEKLVPVLKPRKKSNFIMKTKKVNLYNSETYEKKLCSEGSDIRIKPSAIVHKDQISLSDCYNFSCAKFNLNVNNSFPINKTPSDNNVVPNQWESTVCNDETKNMRMGEEAVDLDLGGSFTNSFLKSSDSLDNKCIINEEDSFGDVMDGFEANTVSRNKDYLLSKNSKVQRYKSMKDYMHSMLLSEIGSARFNFSVDGSEDDVNTVGYKSFVGYYSEYFGVNKSLYNNSVIGAKGQKKPEDVYRAERCITNDEGRESFIKKIGVSRLIDYFESTHEDNNESLAKSHFNKQMEIFKEVDDVRKRETLFQNFEILHLNSRNDVSPFEEEDNIIPPPIAFQSCSSPHTKQGYNAKPKSFSDTGGNNFKIQFSTRCKTVSSVIIWTIGFNLE